MSEPNTVTDTWTPTHIPRGLDRSLRELLGHEELGLAWKASWSALVCLGMGLRKLRDERRRIHAEGCVAGLSCRAAESDREVCLSEAGGSARKHVLGVYGKSAQSPLRDQHAG